MNNKPESHIEDAERLLAYEPESLPVLNPQDDYEMRIRALHEFEALCWTLVEKGEMRANLAEEAIWAFIEYCEDGYVE